MRSIVTTALAALLLLLPLDGALAAGGGGQAAGTKYEAAKGFYLQGGFAVVKTNLGAGKASLGVDVAGGYRFLPWLGADADVYFAARDLGGGQKPRQFGVTFNGKIYPIGLLAPKTLDFLQPYVVMGLGGGNYRIKDAGGTGTFIFRLGAGVDLMITRHIGLYTDASLNATPGFKGSGKGGATGVYSLGGKFVF